MKKNFVSTLHIDFKKIVAHPQAYTFEIDAGAIIQGISVTEIGKNIKILRFTV